LIGGTFSPQDGSASPLLVNHAYYSHAVESGAEFHFYEQVIGMDVQNGQIILVKTTHGSYSAAVIINTAGAWAAEIGKLAGVDLPIHPDSHEAAITDRLPAFLGRGGRYPSSSRFYQLLLYQHITGQIVFCITPDPNAWGFNVSETSNFLPWSRSV